MCDDLNSEERIIKEIADAIIEAFRPYVREDIRPIIVSKAISTAVVAFAFSTGTAQQTTDFVSSIILGLNHLTQYWINKRGIESKTGDVN